RRDLDRVVLGPKAAGAAKRWDAALGGDAGPRERDPRARNRHQLRGAFDAHRFWAEKADIAVSVGNGTHGDDTSWRIALTRNTLKVSADLPLSWVPGTWSTATKSAHASKVGC